MNLSLLRAAAALLLTLTAAHGALPVVVENGTAYTDARIIAVSGTTIYFTATTTAAGNELWKSNGTTAGTSLVKDINPGAASSGITHPVVLGTTLYFFADNGTNGSELWKSDGTSTGTVLVRDIRTGALGSNASQPVILGTNLYFFADNGTTGMELWKSGGSVPTTVIIKDINVGAGSAIPTTVLGNAAPQLVVSGGLLYFPATDGTHGYELWKSDGVVGVSGTSMVADLSSDPLNIGYPTFLTPYGSKLCFFAHDLTNGSGLYLTDGTSSQTVLLKNILPTTSPATTGDGIPYWGVFTSPSAQLDGIFYFYGSDATQTGLWATDGTDGTVEGTVGTNVISSLIPEVKEMTVFNGALYLSVLNNDLWKSDGTDQGTTLIQHLALPDESALDPGPYFADSFQVLGTYLYFRSNGGKTGRELWRTTGGIDEAYLIQDIAPGLASSLTSPTYIVGTSLYFSAIDSTGSSRLWHIEPPAVTPDPVIPIVTSLPATNIATSNTTFSGQAQFNGNVQPNGTLGIVFFQYRDDTAGATGFPNSTRLENTGSVNFIVPVSVGVTGLTPGHTYTYRLVEHDFYRFTYGDEITFTAPLAVGALTNLVPSIGTLSPTFAQNTLAYTMTVDTAVTSFQLTASTANPADVVKIDGTTTVAGTISKPINLKYGNNKIKVEISTSDKKGKGKLTYTVTVNRPKPVKPPKVKN